MDENNIQLFREDLAEEFHALVKSHTTAIEQLLDDFNDDQMLFQIEVEAYEDERIHTNIQAVAPTTDEKTSEPVATHTTEAGREGPALANTNPTPEKQTEKITLPEPEPLGGTQ